MTVGVAAAPTGNITTDAVMGRGAAKGTGMAFVGITCASGVNTGFAGTGTICTGAEIIDNLPPLVGCRAGGDSSSEPESSSCGVAKGTGKGMAFVGIDSGSGTTCVFAGSSYTFFVFSFFFLL
jgi:hypothetical protein